MDTAGERAAEVVDARRKATGRVEDQDVEILGVDAAEALEVLVLDRRLLAKEGDRSVPLMIRLEARDELSWAVRGDGSKTRDCSDAVLEDRRIQFSHVRDNEGVGQAIHHFGSRGAKDLNFTQDVGTRTINHHRKIRTKARVYIIADVRSCQGSVEPIEVGLGCAGGVVRRVGPSSHNEEALGGGCRACHCGWQ
jgi:hypothetical protein